MEIVLTKDDPIERLVNSEQILYLEKFRKTIKYLSTKYGEGNWWLVGGLARDAVLKNNTFSINLERDVDVIIRGKVKGHKEHIEGLLPIDTAYNYIVHIDGEKVTLKRGGIEVAVDSRAFDTRMISFGGVECPSFPVLTLFHLYSLRGQLRPKDFVSALQLGRFLRNNTDPAHPERIYNGFHIFSKRSKSAKSYAAKLETIGRLYHRAGLSEELLRKPWLRSIIDHIYELALLHDEPS